VVVERWQRGGREVGEIKHWVRALTAPTKISPGLRSVRVFSRKCFLKGRWGEYVKRGKEMSRR
jgi:hypothetical protein